MSKRWRWTLAFVLVAGVAHAQDKSVNVTPFSVRAVNFVASHTVRNPGAYVVGTELPISRAGKWSIRKYGSTDCAKGAFACVAVLYTTPDRETVCEWTVQIAESPAQDSIVDLNAEAARFYLLKLSREEAQQISDSRRQPRFVYPLLAQAAKLKGKASVILTIAPEGSVTTVRVVSSPSLLRDALEDWLKQWHFGARRLHGREVASFVYAHLDLADERHTLEFDDTAPAKIPSPK